MMRKVCHAQLDDSILCCTVEKLRPVMIELAYNLESFNPAFTAVLLKVRQLSFIQCMPNAAITALCSAANAAVRQKAQMQLSLITLVKLLQTTLFNQKRNCLC